MLPLQRGVIAAGFPVGPRPRLSLIAAVADNGCIGSENMLPWRLSVDLRRFKALTLGKPVIMGRRTWESIGRPLPGRKNIVVTRDDTYVAEGADVVHSLPDALRVAAQAQPEEVFVIGGGQLYAAALDDADRIYLTRVRAEVKGDTFFPAIDPAIWREVASETISADQANEFETYFVILER